MGNTSSVNFYDGITFPSTKKIMEGNIVNTNGENVPYFIELGFSKKSLEDCEGWKKFINEKIVEYIEKHPDEINCEKTLHSKIMMAGLNWNWPKKVFFFKYIPS